MQKTVSVQSSWQQIAEPEPRVAEPAPSRDRPASAERAVAFLVPAAVIVGLALDGGAFDVVVRGEWGLAIWWVLALGIAVGFLRAATRGACAALVAALGALAR